MRTSGNSILHARSPRIAAALSLVILAAACTPTVRLATDEPIRVHLDVKIEHDVRVRVERELDDLFSESGVF